MALVGGRASPSQRASKARMYGSKNMPRRRGCSDPQMRTANQWLNEYGDSHRNPTNKSLHWVCVPVILWCVLGLLWISPFPTAIRQSMPFANWATVVVIAGLIYYLFLSVPLALGI